MSSGVGVVVVVVVGFAVAVPDNLDNQRQDESNDVTNSCVARGHPRQFSLVSSGRVPPTDRLDSGRDAPTGRGASKLRPWPAQGLPLLTARIGC